MCIISAGWLLLLLIKNKNYSRTSLIHQRLCSVWTCTDPKNFRLMLTGNFLKIPVTILSLIIITFYTLFG